MGRRFNILNAPNGFNNDYSFVFVKNERFKLDTIVAGISSDTKGAFNLWTKLTDSTDGLQVLASIASYTTSHFIYIGVLSTGKLFSAFINASTSWTVTSDATLVTLGISDGSWFNPCLIHDGTKPILTINGVEIAQTVTGSSQAEWLADLSNLDNFRLASLNRNNFGEAFGIIGNIDEVGIYNDNLTIAQSLEIYNSGTPANLTSLSSNSKLVNWYRMGDNPSDNYNVDVSGQWRLYDSKGATTADSLNMDLADRVTDTP